MRQLCDRIDSSGCSGYWTICAPPPPQMRFVCHQPDRTFVQRLPIQGVLRGDGRWTYVLCHGVCVTRCRIGWMDRMRIGGMPAARAAAGAAAAVAAEQQQQQQQQQGRGRSSSIGFPSSQIFMPNRVLRLSAICRSAALNASTIDLNKRPNVPGAMSGQGGDGDRCSRCHGPGAMSWQGGDGGRCSVPRTNDGINCELLHSATTGTPRIFPVVSTGVFSTFKLIRVLAYAG